MYISLNLVSTQNEDNCFINLISGVIKETLHKILTHTVAQQIAPISFRGTSIFTSFAGNMHIFAGVSH